MVTLNNPSIEFCRIENPARAIRFLETIKSKVGYFEDSKGESIDLWLYSENDVEEWNPQMGKLIKAYRRYLVKEEKQQIRTRPPRIDNTYYPLTYYGLDTTRGNFLLLVGKADATKTLFRLLRINGHDVRKVNLGRTVQDKLCARTDMFYYASVIDDEIEPRTGKLRVAYSCIEFGQSWTSFR